VKEGKGEEPGKELGPLAFEEVCGISPK